MEIHFDFVMYDETRRGRTLWFCYLMCENEEEDEINENIDEPYDETPMKNKDSPRTLNFHGWIWRAMTEKKREIKVR